jgi:hypothetical protein
MSLKWKKWGLDFFQSLGRHVGTAGLATLSTSYVEGKISWRALGIGVLCGGIIPTVFTFLQTNPVPEDEEAVTPTKV